VDRHHDFVWRSIRRLGVPEGDVDDAVQKVFLTVASRLADIDPRAERRFLFETALRTAANERRAQSRRRRADEAELEELVANLPSPEQTAVDRATLDVLLGVLPVELRAVFVLFELEQMTSEEIAALLGVPTGTVSSRLRRGRALVEAKVRRMQLQEGGS
jgi:RNA polymerase sigma-70 factor (ECF subfamily)